MAGRVDPVLKAEAQRLRDAGESLKSIERKIGIRRGTLSYWFSGAVREKHNARSKEAKRLARRARGVPTREESDRLRASIPKPVKKKAKPLPQPPREKKKKAPELPPRRPLSLGTTLSIEDRVRARLEGKRSVGR